MKKSKEVREEVWCTKCESEGHSKEQFPLFRNYMASGAPNPLNPGSNLWCEICKTRREHCICYLLQKYVQTPINLYGKFYKSIGRDENNCWAYKLMIECSIDAYRMQAEEHGHEEHGKYSGQGGYQGRGWGSGAGRGHG